MSKDLDLKLRLTATNQGVAGTVRNTKKEVQGLNETLGTTSSRARGTASGMFGLTTAGGEATRMFKLQKGSLQQAGYQFQDLAVQIGSGTSAFVAIGQQGSQLLGILGPGGALLGAVLAIGSVIGGTLVSAMGEGEGATKALDAAMKSLDQTIEDNDGIPSLTREIRDLARESEIAARGRIVSAMSAAEEAARQSARAIRDSFDGIVDTVGFSSLSDFFNKDDPTIGRAEAEAIADLGVSLGLTGESASDAARKIFLSLRSLDFDPTFENFRKLEDVVAEVSTGMGRDSEPLQKLVGSLGEFFDTARSAEERAQFLKNALRDLAGSTQGDAVDAIDTMIEKLKVQAETQGMTTLEMIEYNHQTDLAAARDAEAGDTKIALINQYYQLIKAEEQAVITAKKKKEADAESKAATDAYKASLASLRAELDPAGAALEQYGAKLALLEKAWLAHDISPELYKKLLDNLVQGFSLAGDEAAKTFSDMFYATAVNALLDEDWRKLGLIIGGDMAKTFAEKIGETLAESFGEEFEKVGESAGGIDFKAALGGLGQALSAAAASPLFAPVATAVVGAIADKVADYFGDDWDPTEMRQASQGTGTVLGSINEKSKSIAKAVDISADATSELVGINRAMLRALETVQLGIEGASSRVARGYGGVQGSIGGPGVMTGGEALSLGLGGVLEDAADVYLDYLSIWFTAGLVDLGKLLGGKSKKRDEGIQIIGGYIDDLINSTIVQGYVTYRAKKHALDDYDTYEKYAALDDDVGRQFALVFGSIYDSVAAGLDVFGLDIDQLAGGFKIGTQKLSLEGLNAEQQQEAFEAYFSTVFDKLADYTVPWLDEFQRAGEGLGETLARVATQTQVTQQAIDSLGIQFDDLTGRELVGASQRLVELGGGLDQFISSMQGFIGNFASESQQFVLAQSSLTKALQATGLELPGTRQGFYDLMQAQNGSTEEGAENIATLLRLQGIADNYYTSLEDQADELASTQRSLLQEAQAASGAISDALRGLQINTSDRVALRRESALETLQRITDTGTIKPGDQLNDALSAATQINASDFATFADYITEVSRAGAVLTGAQRVADAQVTREQRALESIERRLQGMQKESYEQRRVITQNTAKTARLLERIEGEPRALT